MAMQSEQTQQEYGEEKGKEAENRSIQPLYCRIPFLIPYFTNVHTPCKPMHIQSINSSHQAQ